MRNTCKLFFTSLILLCFSFVSLINPEMIHAQPDGSNGDQQPQNQSQQQEQNKQNQQPLKKPKDIDHYTAYYILHEFNKILKQKSGNIKIDDKIDKMFDIENEAVNLAKEEVEKKHNLAEGTFEHIQRMRKHRDFLPKMIRDRLNTLKKEKGTHPSPDEIKEIKKQLSEDYPFAYARYVNWLAKNEKAMNKELEDELGCGWTEVTCHFELLVLKNMAEFFKTVLEVFVKIVSIDEKDFYGPNYKRYNLPEDSIYKYQKIVQEFAWALLLLFATYQCVRVLALYTIEPNGMLLKNLILKFIVTAILIKYEPYIIAILLEMNGMIMDGFLEMSKEKIAVGQFINGLIATSSFTAYAGVTMAATTLSIATVMKSPIIFVMLGVLGVMIFMFLLQIAIRFVEIVILAVLGPMIIATNMNEQYNLFPAWWKSLLSTIFTVAVQFFLVIIMWAFATNEMTLHLNAAGFLTKPLVCIAFFSVILKSPSFLKEWMYSTGTGSAVSGAASSIISKANPRAVKNHTKDRAKQFAQKNMNRARYIASKFQK